MKQVIQLDNNKYFSGYTIADESPLEPNVYLMPAGTIDATSPSIPEGYRAKWVGNEWEYDLIADSALESELNPPTEIEIKQIRIAELQSNLFDTDYVGLSDYDKSKPEILAQRQIWRNEIRLLQTELSLG